MDSVPTNDDRLLEDARDGTQLRRDVEATVSGLVALLDYLRDASILLKDLHAIRQRIEAES